MQKPLNELVADMVNKFDATLREDFEERAGIMEFDGNLPRAHAECLALIDVLSRNPNALLGVTLLQVELDGVTQWLLTTDIDTARGHLAEGGGAAVDAHKLSEVINEQFNGIALLTSVK